MVVGARQSFQFFRQKIWLLENNGSLRYFRYRNLHKSSNINEVIRAVLNPLLFFYEKISHSPKAKKAQKALKGQKVQKAPKVKHRSTKTQSSKSTKCYKQTKIKNTLKKHLRGKKLLILLFAFLCFSCARRKKNRKKKIQKTEQSPQVMY